MKMNSIQNNEKNIHKNNKRKRNEKENDIMPKYTIKKVK